MKTRLSGTVTLQSLRDTRTAQEFWAMSLVLLAEDWDNLDGVVQKANQHHTLNGSKGQLIMAYDRLRRLRRPLSRDEWTTLLKGLEMSKVPTPAQWRTEHKAKATKELAVTSA